MTNHPFTDVRVDVVLGVGWRNTTDYPLKDHQSGPSKDTAPRVLRLQLRVAFDNDTTSNILVSDSSWQVETSRVLHDSIYNGETSKIFSPGKQVYGAVVTNGPFGQMYLPEIPPIVEAGVEEPVRIYERKNSNGDVISHIVDFGNNSAGYCTIKLPGGATNVTMHHAEVPMHPPYGDADGSLYYDNLQTAKQLDTVLTDGKLGGFPYHPSFTYHGFRYVEVTGFENGLTSDDIKKTVIHTNVKPNGHVHTSSKILNAIQSGAVRSQLSNMMSIPTDCEQRDERLGWMGDAGLSAQTMMFNFDTRSFHKNFLKLISDELISGTLPDVVPFYRGGSRPADPAWGDAFLEILHSLTATYRDVSQVKAYYDLTKDYILSLKGEIPSDGIGHLYSYYGDWVPPPEQPKVNGSFVSAFSLLKGLLRLVEFAGFVDNPNDVISFDKMFAEVLSSFNKAFLNANMTYLNEIQATYVLPLSLDIWSKTDSFTKAFVDSFVENDNTHITSGIIGARYIFKALNDVADQNDLALELAEQVDYPSWGYMIYNPLEPATAMWELWNSHNGSARMDSRNHHMFSSISFYIKSQAGGLVLPKHSYGLEKIHFFPASMLGLSYANVSLEFPKPVSIFWQRNGGVQCAKSPEDQSPMSLTLPKHGGLVVSCGDENGGVIGAVNFASYGNPTGQCGGYYKINNCHVVKSIETVEELCLGKRMCDVPTGVDFWGDPCPGQSKWLTVEVQCQSKGSLKPHYKYSSITAQVSVPVGSKASLFLPAYGKKDLSVWESNEIIFAERRELLKVPGIVQSRWDVMKDSLVLELESGDYTFTARGDAPSVHCVSADLKTSAVLACETNSSEVITSIDWVSYGSPLTEKSCMFPSIGDCHVGSSISVVKQKCIDKHSCEIFVSENTFGHIECLHSVKRTRLVVKFTCAYRAN